MPLLENQMFSVSFALMALRMWKIMDRIFRPIPKAIATMNTVLSCPINGRLVMASIGRSQRACIMSSNPNTLPNINPKKAEKRPATDMMPTRLMFFSL